MKSYRIILIAILLSNGFSIFANFQSISDKSRILSNVRQNAATCGIYTDTGESRAGIHFEQVFPNCMAMYARSEDFRYILEPLKETTGLEERCYATGYKLRYLRNYNTLWAKCSNDIDRVVEEATEKKIEACQQMAVNLQSENLVELSEYPNDEEHSELSSMLNVYYMSASARYSDAWNLLLEKIGDDQEALISCSSIIAGAMEVRR